MDPSEKNMLIKRGNELFNAGDFKNALKIFMAISYKDGLARIASILEYQKKDRVAALKLYKKAGLNGNVDRLAYEMAQTIRFLIMEDKTKEASQNGENFNSGFKISGQAPDILPHEAFDTDKKNSSILIDPQKWEPFTISRKDLDNFKKK